MSLAKQYLAAHYYLSEERPFCISEAQRAQLGALHLHVSFGPYVPGIQVPDLLNCTSAERKKRIAEWQKLGYISRETAIRKFIDLITNLFPNWHKFRKLFYEFEQEWLNMPDLSTISEPEKKITKKSFDKVVKYEKPEDMKKSKFEFRETTPTAFKKIQELKKKGRERRTQSRIDNYDKSKLFVNRKKIVKRPENSQFPKIQKCINQYREQGDNFLKEFVEDLQSYRGGNLRRTSATKMPEGFAYNDYQEYDYCSLRPKIITNKKN